MSNTTYRVEVFVDGASNIVREGVNAGDSLVSALVAADMVVEALVLFDAGAADAQHGVVGWRCFVDGARYATQKMNDHWDDFLCWSEYTAADTRRRSWDRGHDRAAQLLADTA